MNFAHRLRNNPTATLLLAVGVILCLAVPAALAAPPADKGKPEAKKTKSGATAQAQSGDNASKKCKAERERLGDEAFKALHGTNPNKANAFGKCVSKLAKANKATEDEKDENDEAEDAAEAAAAKKCKAERERLGAEAFKNLHGTNANKANAFGKCVSKLSKAKKGSSS